MKRKILITNDDGIESDGIRRLAQASKKFGEVWVVAPNGQRSAMSHSITLRELIDVYPYDFPVEGMYNEEAEENTDFRSIVDGYVAVGKVSNICG